MTNSLSAAARELRALLAQFTQDTRLLRLHTSLAGPSLLVERVEGREALSETFRFAVTVLSIDVHLDIDALLGRPALLQIVTQPGDLRPLHGHVTAVERLGADGGFARYRLTLEPWLAFLRYRRDSYVWQNKSVPDIVADLFDCYRDQGALVPVWRFALADAAQYKARDVCTQFEESDLAFLERLLAEEGLFYWFEHSGDAASGSLGSHTLVIADHNGAFAPNAQRVIRHHRAAAVEKSDSITAWHAHRQIATNAVSLASWHEAEATLVGADARSVHDNGDLPVLAAIDHFGERRFATRDAAERSARLRLEALEARNKTYTAAGTVRTLAPATTFVLTGHAVHDADCLTGGEPAATFAVISVEHHGRNNLSAQAHALIGTLLGTDPAPAGSNGGPEYANRFTALRADIPWRAVTEDGHGALLHPRPTVTGIHTGIVVGTPGQDIATERDHRVKVQMHWQRGRNGQNRLHHPHGDNAPGNDGASIWIRVAEPAAGPNFGASFVPRLGQEVIVDYIDGDIDRPIVTGSLYNGTGMPDAPGNQAAQGAGPATGNAPAWFAGGSGAHAHNAVLSDFKTQEIGHSRDGLGGYNALIFDDSTGQVGARLQTTQAAAQLNLGHIKRQHDNERRQSHGHGAEVRTDAYGALRAGQGLLVSADARPNAGGAQMDVREARDQLKQAHALQAELSGAARKHNAFSGETLDHKQHERPDAMLERMIESLEQTAHGSGTPAGGGAGTAPSFGRPDLVLSAPAGIVLSTPQDLHADGSTLTVTGAMDVSATLGDSIAAAVTHGISLFTCGDAQAGRKEQGDTGIKLHAAQGKVDIQAQGAELKAAADKDVHVSSTQAKVEVAAKDHVLLAAGGAYVKISGGNIEIHAPGKVEFRAAMKELSGPASRTPALPSLPKSTLSIRTVSDRPLFSQQVDLSHLLTSGIACLDTAGKEYQVYRADGSFLAFGTTNQDGLTDRFFANQADSVKVAIEAGSWHLEERYEDDDIDEEQGT